MSKLRLMSAAFVAASLAVGSTVATAGTKTIKIGDNWFVKDSNSTQTVRISKGSKIKWKWTGADEHNVRASKVPSGVKKSRFTISARTTGTVTSKMFAKAGTYKLYCSIHDDYDPQRVTVKVKAN